MTDKPTQNLILTENQILQKIKRMAYEIYENNFREKELIIAGIFDKGFLLAQMLRDELEDISPLRVILVKVEVDKQARVQSEVKLDCERGILENKCVILVDDVLNSGRTLAYSLKPFLNTRINKLEIAVLVNRSHKLFPVSANYTGYELSTTIEEHIEVKLDEQKGVYLM